jgi:hypothetical protein
MKNSLKKRLWSCRKMDDGMNERGRGFVLTERGEFPPTDECVEIRFLCRSPSCETEVLITAEEIPIGKFSLYEILTGLPGVARDDKWRNQI